VDHDLFAQLGGHDAKRVGQGREDVAGDLFAQGGEEGPFAGQRHAPADDHGGRRCQRDGLRQRPPQGLRGLRQNLLGQGVPLFGRLKHQPGGDSIDRAVAAFQQIGHVLLVGLFRFDQPLPHRFGIEWPRAAGQWSQAMRHRAAAAMPQPAASALHLPSSRTISFARIRREQVAVRCILINFAARSTENACICKVPVQVFVV
jgi:hypothetical protein